MKMNSIARIMTLALMAGIAGCFGTSLALAEAENAASSSAQMDTKPGPAYATVDGNVSKIEGAVYTIQSQSSGYQNMGGTVNVSETRVYVGKDTLKIGGEKKVGDKIRAEVTQDGFANSIQ